jgi:protein-S-isoprenylcysteine O-methyltransferase Ste14
VSAPAPRDASSRFLWPPTIYGGLGGLAALLTRFAPFSFPAFEPVRWTGWTLLAAGVVMAGAAELSFLRAGTATLPISPTTAIVESGVYRFTRNPMYLGMTAALLGLGLMLGSFWLLLATPIATILVTRLAILREEAYLARKFGAPYLAYMSRVRRWL